MKLFLLTLTALITGMLMAACGPKDTNKPELVGPTLEEIIAEPYDADTATYDEITGERLDSTGVDPEAAEAIGEHAADHDHEGHTH